MAGESASNKTGVGARLRRKEDDRFLHGRGQYIGDLRFPRMREVAFVRSPVAHARLTAVRIPDHLRPSVFTAQDLTDVFIALGEAAVERRRGVVLLFDEVQFLSKTQLKSLIEALHKMVQRKLPITMVGAGLPQIAELAGDAKSYAERLFTFPAITNLSPADAQTALARPAGDEGASFTDEALAEAVTITEGYPYFVQELGYAVWTVADGPLITKADVEAAKPAYEAKLDASFFRVRLDRATELQRAYLRAMAELGPTAQKAADVADMMGRTSTNLGPTRAELINMGLLYTPEHGYAAFTVPHFDRFLLRAIPKLNVPPLRRRRNPAEAED